MDWNTLLKVSSPPINADQISSILAGSPLAPYAQDFYNLGATYQLDPRFPIAIAKYESDFLRTGGEVSINNVGGILCVPGGQWGQIGCQDLGAHSFAVFPDIQTGIEAVYRLIANNYFPNGQQTLGDILFGKGGDLTHDGSNAYAPPSDNSQAYFQNLLAYLNSLGGLQIPNPVQPKPNPLPSPSPSPAPVPAITFPNPLQPITDITSAVAAIPTTITNAILSIERFFWIAIGLLLVLAGVFVLIQSSKEVRESERTAAIGALAG